MAMFILALFSSFHMLHGRLRRYGVHSIASLRGTRLAAAGVVRQIHNFLTSEAKLRPLACRYGVSSIASLRGGAGPAWLLQTLFAEFGVDRKVAGASQAAPKQQWRLMPAPKQPLPPQRGSKRGASASPAGRCVAN